MFAVHLENLLFILLVAVAFLFQLLTRVASRASKDSGETKRRSPSPPPHTPPPIPRAKPATDAERIREFLEALGQPTTSKPPAPIEPRPTYRKPIVRPHVGPFASPLPPLTTRPPDEPKQIRLPGQIPPTREAKVFTPEVAEAPSFELQVGAVSPDAPPAIRTAAEAYAIATQPAAKPERTEMQIATLLRSTSGLRDAIILREIFGPPRSLQPLDLIATV
jgi:hypothetical protein